MQMYTFFNSMQYKHTNIMFKKFPKSMKALCTSYLSCVSCRISPSNHGYFDRLPGGLHRL